MSAAPIDIQTLPSHELLVTWNDGHRSLYRFQDLRYYCPCAFCVDEWTGKRTIDKKQIDPEIGLNRFEAVGRYGMKLDWSDGHSTGIYSFDYLRGLCTCAACQEKIQAKETAS